MGPALVGLVTDAITREPISLHRTWIKGNGCKADIEKPRLLLAGHRKSGGVIRLWPDTWVTQGLALAEGIETALAAAHTFTPIWSAIDAGNLADLRCSLESTPSRSSLITMSRERGPLGRSASATATPGARPI